MGELIISVMIVVAVIAKLIIFIKCHKIKYYCDNDNCHLKWYCDKYHDEMGYILLQIKRHEEEMKEAEKAADRILF